MIKVIGKWNVFKYPESETHWDWECSECGNLQTFKTRRCKRCECEMEDGLEIRNPEVESL